MESGSTTEASILSKLQSSADLTGIHGLFTAHLQPFAPFFKLSTTAPKKPVKNSKSRPPDNSTSIRSLGKQFLPLIHKSLSVIPKRLSESPKIPQDSSIELFDSYRLCLDCLDVIAPELAGKPHSVQVQRIRYVHCLEHWELYKEAEEEGLVVLASLHAVVSGGSKGRSRKLKARLVPELNASVDREVAALVLEIVVTLVKCVSKRRSKVDADYWRVLSLVNESEPWFKSLDAKDYEKFHRFLETNLHITVLFLIAETKFFGLDLIREFSSVTFKEYKKSATQDQMCKVAVKVCSSVFSKRDELSTDIILDLLKHVLDFMAAECKVGEEKITQGFLEVVCYCANKCQSATASLCIPVAEHMYRLAGAFREDLPFVGSILRLYGAGLLASTSNNQLKGEGGKNHGNTPHISSFRVLHDNKEQLQQVAASINLLASHFDIGGREKHSHKSRVSHSPPYWDALKFFCQSVAEFIYFNRKEIFSEEESKLSWDGFGSILDVFHHFCYIFLQCLSATERETEASGDNHRVISSVVVASLLLSFRTNQYIKESTQLVKHVISTDWVPVKRLKYLHVSLNNIAVILNRKKLLKKAVKALKLCCKALWNYVVDLCKMHVDGSHVSHDDLSENAIADFVKEASEKVAFLLGLNQEAKCKINGIMEESLKCWSVAENLIAVLPVPVSLVKEWVKIQTLMSKDADSEHGTMLYSLLSSSNEISRKAIGKLLEEELLAYDEKSYLNPRYCLRMRMKIIGILLEEVYTSKDNNINKSSILIEKGKVLKDQVLAQPDEYIQYISDAILILKSIYSAKKSCSSRVHQLLIQAYVLRALWTHEAAPNSMVLSPGSDFLQDVHTALKLCLSPNHDHEDGQFQNMLYLWYQLIDLLSIKGYLEIHPNLYDVVIKLFNEKKFPLAKTMSELWRNKRLSHALCASPVNHMFIGTFSKHSSQFFSSTECWRACMDELKPLVVGFHHTNNGIKQAAADLITDGPLSSCSIFLSSNLHYDLCGRLISSGRMIEALTYAKEAHHLRSKLLQQQFEYSVEKLTETFNENGEIMERSYYGVKTFKMNDLVVTKGSCVYQGCVLTPWNVLSCYLESILQVGFVHELLGNLSEAEMLLRWGRNVSQFQGLPLFEISFSSMLGKLCVGQKLWSMAEKELSDAKRILANNRDIISCKKCLCMLEISINQQIGDLFVSSSCSTGESSSTKRLFNAKSFYKSALDQLNLSEWRTSYSTDNEAMAGQVISKESSNPSCAKDPVEINGYLSNDKSETKIEQRRSRRIKKELKPIMQRQDTVSSNSRRITRSTHRSSVETRAFVPNDQIASTASLATSSAAWSSDLNVTKSEFSCSTSDFRIGITAICNKIKCWHSVHIEAVGCSSLSAFIYMNWDLAYREHCLRLFVSIGKFSGICGNVHEAHEILQQSISLLFSRNSPCLEHSSDSLFHSIESIGKHFPGDLLAVERANLLYYICWFTLKSYGYQGTRNSCCELSSVEVVRIVSLLKMSFVISREVPLLFQKISRLLAAVYVLSTSLKHFSLSPSEEGSESLWASFFHQASIGTHLNQQLLSDTVQKKQSQVSTDPEDCFLPHSVSAIHNVPGLLRLAPESFEDLEEFVLRFFQGLPSTPTICISFVSGADAGLLGEILHSSPTVRVWILLSHLTADNQHVILLPIYNTLEGEASDDDASSSSVVFKCKDLGKQWQCPWVSSVIDDIAPVFRHILEGNYYSSSEHFLEYIKDNTSLWWTQRNRLDECLRNFLLDMEELWLGTWKYLLLGEWPDCNYLNSIQKNLFNDEGHHLQLVVTKKCHVGLRSESSSESSSEIEHTLQLLFKRKLNISDNFDLVEYMNRKPILLVLDSEVQMLPWENLPILRNQEVYRMPSVASIFATLDRCCQKQEQVKTNDPDFPLIDPLDSYYLLNPDGDLSRTQIEFENWFKDQNIEGTIGKVPTVEELTLALKNHDLFIYFGHGSGIYTRDNYAVTPRGTQYIPGHEIQKLDNCAATLLLGCSSGSLYLKGCYMPQGAPISYLLAGSPVIVANLWEVTDKDIDRFGKAMLDAWLTERSAECTQCNRTVNKSKLRKCNHRRRIGSFMAQARDACTLGFLIGASPVCYGVPTGIIKRKNV